MNEIIIAIFLGFVEGLTEFIPVSSTGHLILAGNLLGLSGEKEATFDIVIQLGAILAVVALYPGRFLGLLKKGELGFSGWNGIIILAVACLPAFILGALFHSTIKRLLFSPTTVAYALIVGGIAMLFIERIVKKPSEQTIDAITLRQAAGIGVAQCLALWPGMSRSASTIMGGLIFGLRREIAAEFSFLIAVPVMAAAVGYDLLKSYSLLSTTDVLPFLTGLGVSFIVAMLAIRFFLSLLRRWSLAGFGAYRIVVGILVLAWL